MPLVEASARAMSTPADPMAMTPIFFPLRSENLCTELSAGTAMP